jgi:two-component system, chemotaxis family, sensor kinase CheA
MDQRGVTGKIPVTLRKGVAPAATDRYNLHTRIEAKRMNEILKEFLIESHDNLDRLDRDFMDLEKDGTAKDTISSIFRTIHTIKGTCGFLGFSKLESLAHTGENLLSKLRDGLIPVTPPIIAGLLASVDAIRVMLGLIESTENDGEDEYPALKARLKALLEAEGKTETPVEAPKVEAAVIAEAALPDPEPPQEAKPLGAMLVEQGRILPEQLGSALRKQMEGDPRRIGEILVEQGAIKSDEVPGLLKKQDEHKAHGAVTDTSVRIDVSLLDRLMNLVGELVLERNRILQHGNKSGDVQLVASVQRLNHITSDLQEGVMKTRMQPVGNIWNKLPRVVRDLGVACGKIVRLDQEGKDTELDRTLLEAIKDPLTHLVRNSVDHGIEAPARRLEVGKPEEGVVLLRSFHEGGQVIIEIMDDGAGIDPARIKAKAVEKGLLSSSAAERMADQDALQLIFLPGFSTAEKITNVSGRGVGMDVVKTNIEKIGGQVEIQSKVGHGATFRLKIPLTLAIVPALVVMAGQHRFAIPQVSLRELIRVKNGDGVESIQGRYVYRLRGRLLPLVFLSKELQYSEIPDIRQNMKIVVLHADGRSMGLVVEEIRDTEEIVVKPLGKQVKGGEVFAGATIMGDGKVALILDIAGLARRAHIESDSEKSDRKDTAAVVAAAKLTTLLLLRSNLDGQMVIPLSQVARLEEFSAKEIQTVGDLRVVHYRDEIMPLVFVLECLPERRKKPRDPNEPEPPVPEPPSSVNVVVYSEGGRHVGLAVDQIVDVVDHEFELQRTAARDGVLGTIVLNKRITEVLNVRRLIEIGDPSFFQPGDSVGKPEATGAFANGN